MPRSGSYGSPDRIVVVAITEPLEVFRATRAGGTEDFDALRGSLTSNYERQQKPRKIELVFGVVHMAVSMWTTREAAAELVRRFPRSGTHVARLVLEPGHGVCVDVPVGGEHRSVWGAPLQLIELVADVMIA